MLDYTTNLIDERIREDKEISEKETIKSELKKMIKKHEGTTNYIYKYDDLLYLFSDYGRLALYLNKDVSGFKGYFYLAAKAGNICFKLYEKGYRTNHCSCTDSLFENKDTNFSYAAYAILAGCNSLAIELAANESPLKAVLKGDFEQAKDYLPAKIKDIHSSEIFDQILWTIIYNDEKKMNHYIEKRIKEQRRYAKKSGYASDYMDYWVLALLKFAKERGMKCNLNIIELPLYVLDDDTPVNEEEWRLPEDKELERMLSEKTVEGE